MFHPLLHQRVASVVLGLLVALAGIAYLAVPESAKSQANDQIDIQIVESAFEPRTITVPAGTTVVWTNAADRQHTVTANDGTFDSGPLEPGARFSWTFDQPGTYDYHCGFHPGMQATIIVEPAQSDAIDVARPEPDQDAAPTQSSAPTGLAGPTQALSPIAEPRLAHIHAGHCEDLGPIVHSLEGLRSYRADEGSGETAASSEMIAGVAAMPLGELFDEEFSVHVHKSEPEKTTWLACAEVGSRPEGPWAESEGLYLHMKEQKESGYRGIAMLRPLADGGTLVTIALSTTPANAATVARTSAAPSATYTSSQFGYEIGYAAPWQRTESSAAGGRERVVLFNGSSYITFTGLRAFRGDPQTCVDSFAAEHTSDPRASNFRLDVDENGNPSRGGTEATGAFVIYDHDYSFADGVKPYTLFIACMPLIPDEAVLAIVQNVPTEDYDEQLELRETLLQDVALPR